jgi:hypothetical protein
MFANNNDENESQAEQTSQASVDLEELARKVFELLLRELELENDRTGNHSR